MIKLRIDVDYPYPSRLRSFFYTALGVKAGHDYLRNPKIVARMINESPLNVSACWFFTPKTLPDEEILKLLDNPRHDIGLHIINDPYGELKLLEESARRKIRYYTIHGTARLLGRIIWKRWKWKKPAIPDNFPLESYYQFTTLSLDVFCHINTTEQSVRIAKTYIAEGHILHFHPIWLFQRGRLNQRGPFYQALKRILNVDTELDALVVRRKLFFRIADDAKEYERSVKPSEAFLEKIRERGTDVFTFIERKWCCPVQNPSESWARAGDNVAILRVTAYEDWLKSIGKKTRNMIRKAEKSGITTQVAEPSERLAEGVWRIFNETPIRQERGFPHYGATLDSVRYSVSASQNSTFVGAYLQEELVGFIQLVRGDDVAIISQILSLQKHRDKAINNALIAKTVEVSMNREIKWLMYGRMGNHPSLDNFKQNNGFSQLPLTRYYIPLTTKGRIAVKLGMHRETKDLLPQRVKYMLFPVYGWVSRTRMRIRVKLRPKQLT